MRFANKRCLCGVGKLCKLVSVCTDERPIRGPAALDICPIQVVKELTGASQAPIRARP